MSDGGREIRGGTCDYVLKERVECDFRELFCSVVFFYILPG